MYTIKINGKDINLDRDLTQLQGYTSNSDLGNMLMGNTVSFMVEDMSKDKELQDNVLKYNKLDSLVQYAPLGIASIYEKDLPLNEGAMNFFIAYRRMLSNVMSELADALIELSRINKDYKSNVFIEMNETALQGLIDFRNDIANKLNDHAKGINTLNSLIVRVLNDWTVITKDLTDILNPKANGKTEEEVKKEKELETVAE